MEKQRENMPEREISADVGLSDGSKLDQGPPLYTADAFWDAFPVDEEPEMLPDENDFWIEPN